MVNTRFIQPQTPGPRDLRQGYVARFDNLQDAMGYLKAADTLERAQELDPVVMLTTAGGLGTVEGAQVSALAAHSLAEVGYDEGRVRVGPQSYEWSVAGPGGAVSYQEGATGTAAIVVDGSGFRSVAISPLANGILYQESH